MILSILIGLDISKFLYTVKVPKISCRWKYIASKFSDNLRIFKQNFASPMLLSQANYNWWQLADRFPIMPLTTWQMKMNDNTPARTFTGARQYFSHKQIGVYQSIPHGIWNFTIVYFNRIPTIFVGKWRYVYLCSLAWAWSDRACVIAATLLDWTLLVTLRPSSRYPAPLIPALRPGRYWASDVLLEPRASVMRYLNTVDYFILANYSLFKGCVIYFSFF